jgi:hypothetical protein
MKYLLSFILLLGVKALLAQSVAINNDGSAADNSALVDMKSTTKGMLAPRMTTAQRTAIVTPATGLLVFDNTTNTFWHYNGTAWLELTNYWLRTGNDISNINTGNVGIGVLTPSGYGHGGTNKILEIFNNNSGSNAQSHLILSTNATTGSTGGITWASPSLTSVEKRTGFIGNSYEATSTIAAPSAALTFYNIDAGSLSEKMRISSNGNVGIGNSNPLYKLHIGNATNGLRIEGPSASGTGGAALSIGGNGEVVVDKPGIVGGRFIIKENGDIGVNNSLPQSKIDIGDANIGLAGASMSNAFRVNTGNLGTTFGSEVNIASLGFKAGGNNTALGIRGFRNVAGNDWTGTALLLEYDVDNVTRAAGGGSGFIALGANGNIGIGNGAPTEKLDIIGKIKINDGSQGVDRVLTSDASGVGTWVATNATKAAVFGSFGSGVDLTNVGNFYTTCSITLPRGKWIVNASFLMTASATTPLSTGQGAWVRTFLSDNPTIISGTTDIILGSSSLISGGLNFPAKFAMASGQVMVNNVSLFPKTYYVCASLELMPTTSATFKLGGFNSNFWGENQITAIPMN